MDNDYDWDKTYVLPNWRLKSVVISKQISDLYRYNSFYRYDNGYGNTTWNIYPIWLNEFNCAKFSTRVWADVMINSGISNNITRDQFWPSDVYNQL